MRKALFALPLLAIGLLVVLAVWALVAPRNLKAPPSQLIGRSAPLITTLPMEGLPRAPAGDGMVQIINFWASYCVPCIHEHGQLVALGQDPDVHLTGITFNDQPEASIGFLTRYGNPFDQVIDDSTSGNAIAWGVNAIPTTFVVSASGDVIYRHDGAINPPELSNVQALVEQAKGL